MGDLGASGKIIYFMKRGMVAKRGLIEYLVGICVRLLKEGSVQGEEFLDSLDDYHILKNESEIV